MNKILSEVEVWLNSRPEWLQDAARRLIECGELNVSDIDELVAICKAEASVDTTSIKPKRVSSGHLNFKEEIINLRIKSIKNLKGINALSPRKPLMFSEGPITIIYGQNGSGKSGYVRALKHTCGAKNPGKLLSNVFIEQNIEQGCTITVVNDSIVKDIEWNASMGVHDELKAIELYDSECANLYINDENEVAYEPWILTFFSRLNEACELVGQALKGESSKLSCKLPKLPENYAKTDSGVWFNKLNVITKDSDMESKCKWSSELDNEIISIQKRLSENNPAEAAKKLRRTKTYADNLNKNLEVIKNNLSDDACKEFLSVKANAITKRKAVDEDVDKVFEGAPLAGIGSDTWRLLWESARTYSEGKAYTGNSFPNVADDANCVLCQQPLSEGAKKRLRSFEEFVKGDLEIEAANAEKSLCDLIDNIGHVPTDEGLILLMDSAGISDEIERDKIIHFSNTIEKRKKSLINAKVMVDISKLPLDQELDFISDWINSLEKQALVYDEDAKGDNRGELQRKLAELEAQKWIFQQKKSIEEELKRLRLIQKYKAALDLTNTTQLSNKKSALSEVLITNEYIKRFSDELKMLGGSRIKVTIVKTKTSRGHVFHQIKLTECSKNESAADVLSEGEFRIVSLAAFLADVEGRPNNTPFIFDDPISSLDQDYEEATVKRLVKLCESRQVIIFTHRLSMVALLEDEIKKAGLEPDIICLRHEPWGVGEPGDTPIFAKKPDKALAALLNDRLAKAKKAFDVEGREAYDLIAKGICSDFRILTERLIENELLADVVQRFRRAINTMGKIDKLAIINKDDCIMFDHFMTKYSKYEHSQSCETPVTLPEPKEIEEDIMQMQNWIENFRNRVNS